MTGIHRQWVYTVKGLYALGRVTRRLPFVVRVERPSSWVLKQRIRQKGGAVLMATELKQTPLVLVKSSVFAQGLHDGASWYFHGDTPCRPGTPEDVIDFWQGNVVELAEARLFR